MRYRCYICNSRMEDTKCDCGYDISKDYDVYKTLGTISDDVMSTFGKREEYEALVLSEKLKVLIEEYEAQNSLKINDSSNTTSKRENLSEASIGDTITFGNYNENTEWIVLAKENGKILVISKYALEKRPYNTEYTSITWEKCTLRSWLNGAYLSSAFSSDEQTRIIGTSIANPANASYGTDGGNNTTDKVFLLSIDEVNKYFSSDSDQKATLADGTSVWWWLRSPGYNSFYAAGVSSDGSVNENGDYVDNVLGVVRPALWIDISNL